MSTETFDHPSRVRPVRLRSWALVSILVLGSAASGGGPVGAQVINEVVANHVGTDDHEYLEIAGAPATNYSGLRLLQLEGDTGSNPGLVDTVTTPGTTSATGHWASGFTTNLIDNGTTTFLLVAGWSGSLGMDLDTNDDGTFDTTPWTTLLDSVAIADGGADVTYSSVVLGPNFDGVSFTPGGMSRIPDAADTNSVADWTRNDFDGAGLPGFSGTLVAGEALNTPGVANSTSAAPADAAQISEIVLDHTGTDTHEYLEIFGAPESDYSASTLLVVNGDGNPGQILRAYPAGTTDSDGFWATGFLVGQLQDGGVSVLLVESFSGAVGQDLDTNNDGSFETTPWAGIDDSVAIVDGVGGDVAYSAVVLGPGFGGVAGLPVGVSRVPYGIDTDVPADWTRNDFDGDGLPGFAGDLDPGEAFNTPARVNVVGVTDYYASVDPSNATTLRNSLHEVIDDHVRFPYTATATDTWNVLELADQDPGASTHVLDVYKNASYLKVGGGNDFYNREHSWPRSYGFPDDVADNVPHNDCHHLFLSDITYNSDRGNLPFGSCNAGCAEDPTDLNNGQGGGSGTYPGNSNWFTGSGSTGIWETWNSKRGDLARAQLYMDVRYAGGNHGITGFAEPDLILTNDTGLIQTTGTNASVAFMGRLATLLAWHAADPVDARERLRNEVVYRFQGNRNPFVDHPGWVDCIFAGAVCASPDIFADGFESGDTSAWSATVGGP